MKYFSCGDKIRVPLTMVSGVSWSESARTVEKRGGYQTSIGKEAVTISARVTFTPSVASLTYSTEQGLNGLYYVLTGLATDCVDEPARLLIGDFEPVPSMLFALTSCNKTQVYDPRFDPSMEMDLVFSGVRCVKEESRNKSLTEQETSGQLPDITIKRGGKELAIRDSYNVDNLIIRDSSVEIGFTVRDDLTIINRDGYFVDLTDGETRVVVDKNEYYIVAASVEANRVELVGSFWPVDSQKAFVKTYRDTTLKDLFSDLAKRAGIQADIRVEGGVMYYLNATSPMESITDVAESCGANLYWRNGKLLVVDVPEILGKGIELEAQIDSKNSGDEVISSCVWIDTLIKDVAGSSSGRSTSISSVYRGESRASQCLKRAVFRQNTIEVECPIALGVEQGATVSVQVADSMISGLVVGFEADYMTWKAVYYVSYI